MRHRNILSLAMSVAAIAAPASIASAQFSASSYTADKVFANASQPYHPMGMAFDGTHYWSVDGGTSGQTAEYDAAGNLVALYPPGLDFRSIFSNASGQLFASDIYTNDVYQMTSPGTFTSIVTLGGPAHDQSGVVLNGAGSEYIALVGGEVERWNLTGVYIGAVTLSGYGTGTELSYPQNRGVAAFGSNYLTYADGQLSMWDAAGTRVGTTTLDGAGQNFDSYFSMSYASDGRVWVADNEFGNWRGYKLDGSTTATPEPASIALMATGLVVTAGAARRRRRGAAKV